MEDDPVLKMYEAQAIIIEKDEEISKLERENADKEELILRMRWEKEEMAEKLRKLEAEKNKASTAKSNLGPVWTAIKNLATQSKQQNEEIVFLKRNNDELLEKISVVEQRDRATEEQHQRRHNEELKQLEDRITALETMPRGSTQVEQIRRPWAEPEIAEPLESGTHLSNSLAKHENIEDDMEILQRLEALELNLQRFQILKG